MLVLAFLCVARLHADPADDRKTLSSLMAGLWSQNQAAPAAEQNPDEAHRLLDEVFKKIRHTGKAPPVVTVSPSPVTTSAFVPTDPLRLGLADYLLQVRHQNDTLVSQLLEFEVAGHAVTGAKGLLELQFIGTGTHEENIIRNTVEQALQRSSQPEFQEFNERWDTAFEKILGAGGKLRVGYHLDDLNNNLQQLVPGGDTFNEFRSFAGVTFTQPVLRNGGHLAAHAKIRVAEKERDIAFHIYRREMLRILAEAGAAYYELAKNKQRIEVFKKSVEIAEHLVALNTSRLASGLIAESELLESEVGLALRRSQQDEALRDLTQSMNKVRTYLYRSPVDDPRPIEAIDAMKMESVPADLRFHLQKALARAPEYQVALKKAEREGVKLAFARNQTKPLLDVKSAYGLNGLDTTADRSAEDLFRGQHPSWSIGFEFRVPLEGNKAARGDLDAARDRRRQALIEIRTTEVELGNAIDTGVKAVELTARQMTEHEGMVANRRKLLEAELTKMERGLSSSRAVLQRDDDLNRVLEDQLEAAVSHEKAVLALEVTRGTLLDRFGIDPMR